MSNLIILSYLENPTESPRLQKLVLEAVGNGAVLICADRGGEIAFNWGLTPDYLVGDMDSINPDIFLELSKNPSIKIQQVKAEKDETDLEMALLTAVRLGGRDITIIGATGGRLDHTLGNLFLLASPVLDQAGVNARIVSENEDIYVLNANSSPLEIHGKPGDVLSLFPLNGPAEGIVTSGLYYPLRNETLHPGPSRGISNVMTTNDASIGLINGQLLVLHFVNL